MVSDAHIFISRDDLVFTVQRDGVDESTVFPSLSEALRDLRAKDTGFVVIHEAGSKSANRIPLKF